MSVDPEVVRREVANLADDDGRLNGPPGETMQAALLELRWLEETDLANAVWELKKDYRGGRIWFKDVEQAASRHARSRRGAVGPDPNRPTEMPLDGRTHGKCGGQLWVVVRERLVVCPKCSQWEIITDEWGMPEKVPNDLIEALIAAKPGAFAGTGRNQDKGKE